ncbi:hypothetical protein EVAR_46184_1 [Eumeta japonica]|uniref:Uncharacterized protein n=1 Tax=Eumeta variegata TaxID=151549 RepID=A0A4C1Y2T3_EUMVA|nr:hypothetical protein EVAR_46184_1 [Eumeta japonica]
MKGTTMIRIKSGTRIASETGIGIENGTAVGIEITSDSTFASIYKIEQFIVRPPEQSSGRKHKGSVWVRDRQSRAYLTRPAFIPTAQGYDLDRPVLRAESAFTDFTTVDRSRTSPGIATKSAPEPRSKTGLESEFKLRPGLQSRSEPGTESEVGPRSGLQSMV